MIKWGDGGWGGGDSLRQQLRRSLNAELLFYHRLNHSDTALSLPSYFNDIKLLGPSSETRIKGKVSKGRKCKTKNSFYQSESGILLLGGLSGTTFEV